MLIIPKLNTYEIRARAYSYAEEIIGRWGYRVVILPGKTPG